MPQLTEEQKSYIVEHINDRPRTAVAKTAGVSMTMLYRVVRMYGGDMAYERTRRNPQHVEIVKKYYPTMTGSEIEAKFSIRKKRAEKIAHELGIKHTPETQERIRQKIQDKITNNRHKIDFKELGHKRSVRYKMEYYRKWAGLKDMQRQADGKKARQINVHDWAEMMHCSILYSSWKIRSECLKSLRTFMGETISVCISMPRLM